MSDDEFQAQLLSLSVTTTLVLYELGAVAIEPLFEVLNPGRRPRDRRAFDEVVDTLIRSSWATRTPDGKLELTRLGRLEAASLEVEVEGGPLENDLSVAVWVLSGATTH